MKKSLKDYWNHFVRILKDNGIAITCFIFIFVIAVILHLFGILESFQQFVVVIASAAATYIIVCVTMSSQSEHQAKMQQILMEQQNEFQLQLVSKQSELQKALMEKQSENEANKTKDIRIYEKKLEIYSDFVSKMYGILDDNEIEKEEILDLRSRIFGQISFYVTGDVLEKINTELEGVESYKDTQKMQPKFTKIACLLEKDLREDWPVNENSANNLWITFDKLLDDSEGSSDVQMASANMPKCFWHFAMWGADEQLKALREGLYELNLIEINGEEWRTNLIKQVQENDLVFLFRSGGWGYMGIYRVKGWRVFESDGNNVTEMISINGEKPKTIEDVNKVKEDLLKSDIYGSIKLGTTLEYGVTHCSSIIVEPLAFSSDGIGNPGGVYRRTISRYDFDYGKRQLARFMAIMEDDNVYNVHNGVKMGCNKELFKMILDNYNIKKASRDDKGNWQ